MSGTEGNAVTADIMLAGSPENMPSDPDEIARILGNEGDTAAADAAASATPGAQPAQPDAAKDAGDTSVVGVATKDGKHIIPYEVHQGLRRDRDTERAARVEAERKANDAESRANQLATQIEQLKQHQAAQAAGTATEEATAEIDALFETLEEQLPAVGKAIRAMRDADQGKISKLEAMITTLSQEHASVRQIGEAQRQAHQQSVNDMANEAFDHTPKLRFLQDKNPELYDRAVELDEILRNDAKYKNANSVEQFAQRYNAVIALLEAESGPIELPAEYLTTEEIQRIAEAKLKGAGNFRPNTLSDLPGGIAPGSKPEFDSMDASQLYAVAQNMNDAQLDALLSRVA